jgi:cytochrome o ubiquinol oxidase operon protein cyoD
MNDRDGLPHSPPHDAVPLAAAAPREATAHGAVGATAHAAPHDHSGSHHCDDLHGHGDEHGHGSMRSYMLGFALSVVLTVIPFWLVMTGVLRDPQVTAVIIAAMAVAQIVVHTICFLHVNSHGEGGWTLMAYLFTAVLVLITIGGSLWIMYHLNTNMMPGTAIGSAALTTP